MITPNGPPSCGWVIRTTVSWKRGSRISRLAMRKMPFATTSAAATVPVHASIMAKTSARHVVIMEADVAGVASRMPQNPEPDKRVENAREKSRLLTAPTGHSSPSLIISCGAAGCRDFFRLDERQNPYAIAHRRHLGKDGDCDLRGRLAADLEPHRSVQALDLFLRKVELREPSAARIIVFLRADGSHVERRGLERLQQREVVELGVVRERHDRGVAVGIDVGHDVVGHAALELRSRNVPALGVFDARVADRDLIVQSLRHLREKSRKLPGADYEQAPAGTVYSSERPAVEAQLVVRHGRP